MVLKEIIHREYGSKRDVVITIVIEGISKDVEDEVLWMTQRWENEVKEKAAPDEVHRDVQFTEHGEDEVEVEPAIGQEPQEPWRGKP